MSSSFTDSFGQDGEESRSPASTHPFDDDCYLGYDPRLSSQRFDLSAIFNNSSYSAGDDGFTAWPLPETPSPQSIYASCGGFSTFSPESNGKVFDEGFVASNGPILPAPSEMQLEEGFALREWRRQAPDLDFLSFLLSWFTI